MSNAAEKAALAKKNGADEVILYKDVPLEEGNVSQNCKQDGPEFKRQQWLKRSKR